MEYKFEKEVLFRIKEGYSYAGKVVRAKSIEQRPKGNVYVRGACAGAAGGTWQFGTDVDVHEKTPLQVVVDAGIDLEKLNAYLEDRKQFRDRMDAISEGQRLQREAEKSLRDAAPELLAALQKLIPHVLHYAAFTAADPGAHKDAADARAAIAKAGVAA